MNRLLLIEDEDYACEKLLGALQAYGYETDVVATFTAALKLLNASINSHKHYAAVLTDWHLQEGTGTDVIYWLRQNDVYRNVPVIASSSLQYKFDSVFQDMSVNRNIHGIPKTGFDDIWDIDPVISTLEKVLTRKGE